MASPRFAINRLATSRIDVPPAWYAATILCRKSKECVGISLSSHFYGLYPIIAQKTVIWYCTSIKLQLGHVFAPLVALAG